MIIIKGPLKVKDHKLAVILVSFLGGRSRFDRELGLTVNQERAKVVTKMKERDIKEGGKGQWKGPRKSSGL